MKRSVASSGASSTTDIYRQLLDNSSFNNTITFGTDGPEYPFDMNDLDELQVISFTHQPVKQYLHIPTTRYMAIKFINIPYSRDLTTRERNGRKLIELAREVETHKLLRENPNIVQFYGFSIYNEQCLISMELMDFSLKV